MKKIVFKVILLAGLLFAFALQSSAQSEATPGTTKRQVKQTLRIAEGKSSGELTRRETKNLKRQQRHIRRTKRAAKADGIVTKREKAAIQHKQNKASRNIARKKNNGRTAGRK